MRLKSSYLFVIVVLGALVLLFGVVSLFGGSGRKHEAAQAKAAADAPLSVQVALVQEVSHPNVVILRGRTESARTVVVRSETSGVVAQAPAQEGAFVAKGAVLCRLAVDARQASLDQARAALKSRQLQQQASKDLAAKGFRSPTQVLEAQSNLDAAQAAVRQAEIALDQVNIRSPFAGVFDHREAEIGAYLAPGQACGTVIELNPLLVVGDAPEAQAARLHVGAAATARLIDGKVVSGRVRYVAHDADPQTRTYHVEIAVANPGMVVRSGLSAEARVGAGAGPAHLAPVSSLVLDSAGRQGLRYVTPDSRVAFAPVTVMEQTPQGVWVSGLKGPVRVITVGQSYVADGNKVRVAAAR